MRGGVIVEDVIEMKEDVMVAEIHHEMEVAEAASGADHLQGVVVAIEADLE